MTLTNIGPVVLPQEIHLIATYTTILDAADEYVAFLISIPKTGTLKKVCIATSVVTTTDNINVSIETVSAQQPSGTLYATGATGSITSPATETLYWVAINGSSGISVTKGDQVAIKCTLDFVDGNLRIYNSNYIFGVPRNYPFVSTYTDGSYGIGTALPAISLQYTDEMITELGMVAVLSTPVTYNNTSTTNFIGNMIKFPFGCRAIGVIGVIDVDYDTDIKLYDSSTVDADFSTPLATVSLTSSMRGGTGGANNVKMLFSTPVTLTKDLWYRLVAIPTTANNIQLSVLSVLDDGSLKGIDTLPMGQNCVYTSCDGTPGEEADWTQTDNKRASLSLIIDQIDVSTSSGGGRPAFGDRTGGKS